MFADRGDADSLLRRACDTVQDGLIVADRDAAMVFCNPAAHALLDEHAGLAEVRSAVDACMAETASGRPVSREIRYPRPEPAPCGAQPGAAGGDVNHGVRDGAARHFRAASNRGRPTGLRRQHQSRAAYPGRRRPHRGHWGSAVLRPPGPLSSRPRRPLIDVLAAALDRVAPAARTTPPGGTCFTAFPAACGRGVSVRGRR